MRGFVIILACLANQSVAGVLDNPPDFVIDRFAIDAQGISDCMRRVAVDFDRGFVTQAMAECVGKEASQCLSDNTNVDWGTPDRMTYLSCAVLETKYWEWRLKEVTAGLSGARENSISPDFLHVEELEKLVGIWRDYAAQSCRYGTSEYGLGPGRGREGGINEIYCIKTETARFALDMEFRLRAHCDFRLRPNYGDACEFDE